MKKNKVGLKERSKLRSEDDSKDGANTEELSEKKSEIMQSEPEESRSKSKKRKKNKIIRKSKDKRSKSPRLGKPNSQSFNSQDSVPAKPNPFKIPENLTPEEREQRKRNLIYYGSKFKKQREQNTNLKSIETELQNTFRKPNPRGSVETQNEVKTTVGSTAVLANNHFKNFYEYQTQKKSTEFKRVGFMQKLVVSDLIGTFFGLTGMIIELISSKILYEDSAVRIRNGDGTKTEYLTPGVDGTAFAFYQSTSTFCTLVCMVSIYFSYQFELGALKQRNQIRADGKF